MDNRFGAVLKHWRGVRRLSQLDLALAANVSARHVSFLETGRSAPSRPMVLQLAETLDMPRAARNALLDQAGYAPAYKERSVDDSEMREVRLAMQRMIDRHDPYPAIAIDRHWNVEAANVSATFLLKGLGIGLGDSLLEAALEPRTHEAIENWPEVAQHMMARLRTENAYLGGDPILERALARLSERVDPSHVFVGQPLPAIIPTRYRSGDLVLSMFSMFAQFGTAEDIALADLKIELMFPADPQTRQFLERLGTGKPATLTP
jgi:transcriptional regulator with XRE-family HTH domain